MVILLGASCSMDVGKHAIISSVIAVWDAQGGGGYQCRRTRNSVCLFLVAESTDIDRY